jgi:serine/threonine protein kinase/Tfp pilus assembly protein PilF
MSVAVSRPDDSLTSRAEWFERALSQNPDANLLDFLPPGNHPLCAEITGELVRLDLAHAWGRGTPRRLAEYCARFPALFVNPAALAPAAHEEFRWRRRRGEVVSAAEYQAAYGIDTSDWPAAGPGGRPDPVTVRMEGMPFPVEQPPRPEPSPCLVDSSDPDAISQWVKRKGSLPEPGTDFLGFRLLEELGSGAFGRVYLARQADLAGRPVALKIAYDVGGESRVLAQLQHTNIVPVYSYHCSAALQAVCMPYLGRVTLADVVHRLNGRTDLPSSGRELRTTLCQYAAGPGNPSAPTPALTQPGLLDGEPVAPTPPPVSPRTCADDTWARLDGLSYPAAVLWLCAQLADGLAHAHARGILHRDLKPANVLLADDGRPMLLDFSLAEDTKLHNSAERAAIGGTLPYMAPEQMRVFRDRDGRLDARADIYSLGVMLYELLAGRRPFPARRGPACHVLTELLADRMQPPPPIRTVNPAVSPAAEAIVRKCLAFHPEDRYRTAEDLREDIDRHLNHLPLKHAPNASIRERLRKWARRHPRLTSSGTVALLAVALMAALGANTVYARERAKDLHARSVFADHRTSFAEAQLCLDDRNQSRPHLDESLAKLHRVLERYRVPKDGTDDGWLAAEEIRRLSDEDRLRVRKDVGETFYLMAQVAHLRALGADDTHDRSAHLESAAKWSAAAGRLSGEDLARSVREQQVAIAHLGGNGAEAERLRGEAARVAAESPRDTFLVGLLLTQKGRHREALPYLRKSTLLDPKNFSAWFVRGTVHLALDQNDAAVACFTGCLALRDDFAPAWLNRGLAQARLRAYEAACEDYDRAVALDPSGTEPYVQRAAVRVARGDLKGAEADYDRAIATGGVPVRIHFLRAHVRDRLGNATGAKADREKGLSLTPSDELSWVGRAETRLSDDPKGALSDVEEALKINPFSVPGLQLKAHILGERMGRADDALRVLNRAVELHPDHVPVRAGRGVELARRGQREAALRDAAEALLRDTRPPNLYQVACIYALTSKTNPEDKAEALKLLWASLKTGFGLDIVDTDTDLDPLRKGAEFKRLVAAARDHAARGQ